MFNNNASYQEAINAPSRRITGNVTIKGQKLSDDILSIDYVSSISGNTLTIGATNASTVDIKFKKLIEGLEERELIKVSFSVQTSSGIVERQIGEFFLTEIKLDRNNKTTTLKAIDKMAFLNDKYTSTLLYPTLGRNIVQEIANSCNLRVNNNLNITNLPSFSKKLDKVTYREMLGYLAQTVGAFVIFNNNGELEFRKLNRTQKQISKGSYLLKGLEVDEVEYRINGISISLNNQEKTILAVGSPLGTQVKLSNPLMTQGWLNSIFSEYSRLRFNPFKLNWRGDPFVEVGDWVSIEIANGSYRAFPILELKLSYSGGLKSTIGANVKGTTTSTTEYKGTVERQIEFINARLGASGNYVYADTVEPTNPKEGDTWFKPNGAFTDLYIYENNQWVLKTSTGNIEGLITKITDSSVSTQNLATAIAKIIELDAARITTGSLSFEQLSSNTVSEIRKGMVSETKFNSFVNDANGLRQQMSSEIERVVESKKSTLKGRDGISSYIHTRYSDNANGSNFDTNSNRKYIGVYAGEKEQAPTNASEYSWTKIRGEDGARGRDGNNGRDGVDGKSINENLLPNSNFNQGFAKWEDKLTNSGLNHSFDHANFHFGRGLHIYGTANADYKGLSSVPFNLIAKQGDKLTLSMDLGKDALTQNAPLRLALHYMDDRDAIVSQQWQTIDLATQNFEVKKYKRISMVFTVQNEIRKCRVMVYATVRQLINFYIDNIKLERGDTATEWSPAYEDLRGRDGVSNYIHRKYSDFSNGANMSDNSNLKYIGIYTGTSPTSPTTASSYLWSKIKGEDGANGTPGVKGADGRTPYFHTAYANSPNGDRDFSTTNSSDKLYIGTYSDFEVADSTDYRKYKWVKIKGEDGRNGNNGRDGVSSYIYRKYSDNANGSPMSDNSNLKYIGIYTGTSATAPTTPSAYTWSKIKGEDGQQGVPGARGSDGRTSYLHTAYANSATGERDFSTTNSNGKEYIGTYTDFEINDSNDYRRYKWVKIKGENGRDGNNGRDGRNGDSYTRNYLSGTAEEKILTAVNDNFVTQEAFKLVDGKAFRDLGFNIGDKITFIADYEVLPNGTNKKISRLNFEWYDDNRYRFWMNQDLNPTKGTFTRTVTVNNDLLDSKRAFLRTDNVNAKIKITNARVIKGDTVQPWSIAQEDLQGHTLTANLWFSGNYINNVTSNVRLNLVVYYDGKEIRDFNANIKYVGGGINDWRTQENVRVLRDNTVDYGFWSNSEKNGTPLFALAIVSYKGLQIISDARLDNVPNVEDIKETIKKFKTFESTLDSFKSVIGEIKSKEIKTIINTPNLCTEDFSNNKSKRGNDLYFNVSPSLKANTKYTVIVDVSLEKVEVHQKTKVYGAKSGGGEQWLKSGRNVWIVDYATEQTRVNIYPLGEFSKVFNVEIYEGDYREFIEQNNRFVSMDTAKREQSGFYSYKINHNINNGKGKYFLVKFDLASLPADKWFASGDNGTLALYSFGAKQFTEELKLKDNEYIFKAHLDDTFYIFHSTNSLNLINVRLYEVRFGVTLATQNSLIDISSMIDQSKEAVTLSARKEIEGKLTNYPTNAYLLNNFANKQELENLVSKSELKVLSDRIESSVNTGNFGTTLSQNAYYVRVAWNSISNYVQFENGGLNFYEGSTTQNNLRARIDDGNYTFWRDGYNLGNMGTGYYAKDNNKKGIQFHLEYDGWFMGWAYKQKRTDNFYTWKWYYTSGSVGDTYADTLNAGCNTNFRWNEIWYFKTRTSWFNIMDGLNGTISVVSNIENTGDGGIRWWTRNLTFKNGILIGG